jgi:hypothetical protein
MTTRPGYVWDATTSEWVEIGQAAVVAPVAYQASEPSSPATGDIWIDSDDEVPSVDSTLYYRWTKTMSGGETSLSGTDNNSLALKYTPGYESVFINGVLQVRGQDYVATTGTTVTGLTALTASDVVMVESIIAYSVGDTYTQSTLDGKFSPITTTGLVLLNSTAFTTQSSVSIDSIFSATYDNYVLVINVLTSANEQIRMRYRASGANDTTSNYRWHMQFSSSSSTSYVGLASATESYNLIASSEGTVSSHAINLNVFSPFLSENTKFLGLQNGSGPSGGGPIVGGSVHGQFVTTTSFTGFSFYVGTGTMTGTIKVYGYK